MIASYRAGRLHRTGASLLPMARLRRRGNRVVGRARFRAKPFLGLVGVLVVLLGCGSGGSNTGGGGNTPPAPSPTAPDTHTLDTRVFPAEALPFGQDYAAWSVEWWQWAVSLPADVNPLLDETGDLCAAAQRGAVWFLAGVLSPSGLAMRHCSDVPAGTALFLPLVIEWDTVQVTPPLRVDALRQLTSALVGGSTELAVTLDGVPLQNPQLLRFTSPAFSITLPQNNLFEALGNSAGAPGTYFPTVTTGVYVMLRPLAVGEHTLRLRGQGRSSALDITFQLTVVPLVLP